MGSIRKKMDTENTREDQDAKSIKPKCGLIMPISSIDGCTEQHWTDVKEILHEAIQSAGFEPNLVSNADDIGIIQKTIIQNIYDNPIIVCDVSGKNPNVMFELGMRLAFDKPTIIVKDDKTSYSFDTSPIEHLTYPRDLRFNKIVEFKKDLSEKIKGTIKKSKEDKNFSTFLKHFGKFTVAKLETTEVSQEQYVIEEIRDLRYLMQRILQKDLLYRQKSDESEILHSICDDAFMQGVSEYLSKSDINIREMSPAKVQRLVANYLVNSKLVPNCFEINNKQCQDKINEAVNKVLSSQMLRTKFTKS
jgi:hypothetical protein